MEIASKLMQVTKSMKINNKERKQQNKKKRTNKQTKARNCEVFKVAHLLNISVKMNKITLWEENVIPKQHVGAYIW